MLKTLKNSYIDLHSKNESGFFRIESMTLNPKSISMDELYGNFDPLT